jgi:hypothetical protein
MRGLRRVGRLPGYTLCSSSSTQCRCAGTMRPRFETHWEHLAGPLNAHQYGKIVDPTQLCLWRRHCGCNFSPTRS